MLNTLGTAMDKPQRILLVGAGGHAHSCIDVLESAGWKIVGLIGLPDEVDNDLLGYRVLGTDKDRASLRIQTGCDNALVVIGQIQTVAPRIAAFDAMAAAGFRLPSVVSASAYVSRHAQLGEGSIVMHGAIVNAGARIGRNCIINSFSLVEHDVSIGDHCHLATRSTLNGGVTLGARSFVGSGAVVCQALSLGEDSFIPMGRVIKGLGSDGTPLLRESRA